MKTSHFFFLLPGLMALSLVSAQSQLPIQISDRFSPPDAAWLWPLDPDTTIERTGIRFFHPTPTSQSWLTRECLIRQEDDFRMSLTMLPEATDPNFQVGIVYGISRDRRSYVEYLIRADGAFALVFTREGNKRFLIPWTGSRKLRFKGNPFELGLYRRKRKLYLFVDGKEIGDVSVPPITGKLHGIMIKGAGTAVIEAFSIARKDHELTLAGGRFYNPVKRPLDSTVNDPFHDETAPIPGADRQSLYFSRGPIGDLTTASLYQSRVQGDSMWGLPSPLFQNVSTGRAEVWATGEQDLEWVHGTENESAALRSATGSDTLWSLPPTAAQLPGLPTGVVSVWQSDDRRILVFSARMDQGLGSQDLWVSFRKENEGWSQPENLGADINTFSDEFSPWLNQDATVLFFASGGHPGYGGWDIYRCERLNQAWTQWSEPENLGPGINTPYDEAWYHQWAKDRAYIAGQDTLHGDFDLYGLRLPMDPAELPVVDFSGRIVNQKTGETLSGELIIRAITGDSMLRMVPVPGAEIGFRARVEYQRAYQIYGISSGFFPLTDTLDLRAVDRFREIRKDVYVVPLEVGESIRLDNVYFVRASPELLEESHDELDRLVALMKAIPTLQIQIQGHTDNIGDPGELQILSEMRAEAVKWYLIGHGIEESRLSALGLGDSSPVADNHNPETRPLNRRVEFVIVRR